MRIGALLVTSSLVLFACVGDGAPPIKPPPPPDPLPPVAASNDTSDAPPTPTAAPKAKLDELATATLKAIVDAVAARDAKKLSERYAGGAVVTVYGQGVLSGRADILADFQAGLDASGDAKVQIGRVLMRGDAAVVEWAFTATHTGDSGNFKATSRAVGALGVSVVWFDADGLVNREHRLFDRATLLAQDDKRAKTGTFRAPPSLPDAMETHLSKGGADEEKLVEVARRLQSAISNKKESDALALFADDLVFEDLTQARAYAGTKDAKALFASLTKVLPDGKGTTMTTLAADDLVALESERAWSPKAGDKAVKIHVVTMLKIVDGKIAKAWRYASATELSDQLRTPSSTAKKPR
jgi:ketosteroid isomerase-like protein